MISAVIIDYMSVDLSYNYCKHLIEKADVPISIVIVDNSDSDENFTDLVNKFKSVSEDYYNKDEDIVKIAAKNSGTLEAKSLHCLSFMDIDLILVQNKANSGFAKGNNIGIKVAEYYFKPEQLLITNNDIEILSSDTLSKMSKTLKKNKTTCIVGPYIEGIDGIRQSPHKRQSLWTRWFFPYAFWPVYSVIWRISPKLCEGITTDIIDSDHRGYVYRVIAAFCLADKKNLYKIGLLDENTFLYSEEMILGEKIKNANMKVLYLHDIKVIHEQGATTKKAFGAGKRLLRQFESEKYYYKEYMNMSDLQLDLTEYFLKLYIKLRLRD